MPQGKKIVLTAPVTESTEKGFSPWRQMMYASIPAKYIKRRFYQDNLLTDDYADGTASAVPYGLRIVEELLLRHFPAEDIAVTHPHNLDKFVGPETRVVGVAAHNPIGQSFSTGVYSSIMGSTANPVNALESRAMFLHPVMQKYRPRVIVGGAGAWQIEKMNAFEQLGVDTVVIGRGDAVIEDIFLKAVRGEPLPRVIRPPDPPLEQIVVPKRRSTYGIVEMTRGCGRACAFCAPTLEPRVSIPKEKILESVRGNVREGGKMVFPVSEDIFIYQAKMPFYIPNREAILDLYDSIARVPGVEYLALSHATIAPALVDPELIRELSQIILPKTPYALHHKSNPNERFICPLIGIETGSPRLADRIMRGKALPFKVEHWQDIVVNGLTILNENKWYPVCTFLVGSPDETDDDVKQSLELIYKLRNHKLFFVPSIFTPLEETRLGTAKGLHLRELSELQWEFILTCWKYSLNIAISRPRTRFGFRAGMTVFWALKGRRIHGPQFTWPAMNFANLPGWLINRKLHLGRTPISDSVLPLEDIPAPYWHRGEEAHVYSGAF